MHYFLHTPTDKKKGSKRYEANLFTVMRVQYLGICTCTMYIPITYCSTIKTHRHIRLTDNTRTRIFIKDHTLCWIWLHLHHLFASAYKTTMAASQSYLLLSLQLVWQIEALHILAISGVGMRSKIQLLKTSGVLLVGKCS